MYIYKFKSFKIIEQNIIAPSDIVNTENCKKIYISFSIFQQKQIFGHAIVRYEQTEVNKSVYEGVIDKMIKPINMCKSFLWKRKKTLWAFANTWYFLTSQISCGNLWVSTDRYKKNSQIKLWVGSLVNKSNTDLSASRHLFLDGWALSSLTSYYCNPFHPSFVYLNLQHASCWPTFEFYLRWPLQKPFYEVQFRLLS